jgi:hypothetical protein
MDRAVTLQPTTLEDCLELSETIRPQDALEVLKAGATDPLEAIIKGYHVSDQCITARDSQGVIAIYGTCPSPFEGVGVVWLLASHLIDNYWVKLARMSRPVVADLMSNYRTLTNATDQDNVKVIRWLRWCGFSFIDEPVLIDNSFPFKVFYKHKDN